MKVISAVQSRISKRAIQIANEEVWEAVYKTNGKRDALRETKDTLKQLRSDQKLDKMVIATITTQWRLFNAKIGD